MTLVTSTSGRIRAVETKALDFGNPLFTVDYSWQVDLADGTGDGQASVMFSDIRQLTSGASDSLDLNGTALAGALGGYASFTRVKLLFVEAAAANTTDLTVGAAASNAWVGPFGSTTGTLTVKPGGHIKLVAPDATAYPVVATTGDILKIANGAGAAAEYRIIIVGA